MQEITAAYAQDDLQRGSSSNSSDAVDTSIKHVSSGTVARGPVLYKARSCEEPYGGTNGDRITSDHDSRCGRQRCG